MKNTKQKNHRTYVQNNLGLHQVVSPLNCLVLQVLRFFGKLQMSSTVKAAVCFALITGTQTVIIFRGERKFAPSLEGLPKSQSAGGQGGRADAGELIKQKDCITFKSRPQN